MIAKGRTVPMRILYNNDRPQYLFGRRNRKSLFAAIVPLLSGKEQKNPGDVVGLDLRDMRRASTGRPSSFQCAHVVNACDQITY